MHRSSKPTVVVQFHVGVRYILKIKIMCVVICPKCHQPVFASKGVDYVICCNDVIFINNNSKSNDNKETKK